MTSNIKRLAIIIDTLNGGGAEKVCLTLFDAMNARGIESHLIVLKKKCVYDLGQKQNIHFIYKNPKIKLYKKSIQEDVAEKIILLTKNLGGFDACLSNLDETHAIVSKTNLPNCFYVIHNSVDKTLRTQARFGPFKYFRNLKAIKSLNGKNLITVSEGIKKELENSSFIRAKSITTIYNPVDINLIQKKASEKTKNIPSQPYIIFLGRVAKQKRIDILIQSFQRLKSYVDLVVLTNNRKKLSRIINKNNVKNKNIIVEDFKQNPYPWIKNAKALVLSSDYEGLGMVLIEALACGTPVASTDCPHGPNEILTGELAQFLAKPGEPVELAKKIDLAISTGMRKVEIMDKVSLDKVVNEYLTELQRY